MSLITSPWTRITGAAALSMSLSGCFGNGGPPVYTPREAAVVQGSLVGGFGAAACEFIEDSRMRRACFKAVAGGATAAAANASARAATTGHCDQYDGTNRTARRDNTTGRVTYDRTTQERDIDCRSRLPNSSSGGVRPIF